MKTRSIILVLLVSALLFQPGKEAAAQEQIGMHIFAEAYNETIYQRREGRNTVTMAQLYEGVRQPIPGVGIWDTYLKIRYGSDANKDFWNNRGEVMLGTRLRFFEKVYLALYSEYVRGEYIDYQEEAMPYDPSYEDWRYGLIFWHGWDPGGWAPKRCLPFTPWSEVYADANYLDKDDYNFIYYIESKMGLQLLRVNKTRLDLYGVVYAYYDKNADFWNNHADVAPGIRFTPWGEIDLNIRLEYVWGQYYDRLGRYENPYALKYEDVRIGLFFWYGWGE
jgi:hypothetical protein